MQIELIVQKLIFFSNFVLAKSLLNLRLIIAQGWFGFGKVETIWALVHIWRLVAIVLDILVKTVIDWIESCLFIVQIEIMV